MQDSHLSASRGVGSELDSGRRGINLGIQGDSVEGRLEVRAVEMQESKRILALNDVLHCVHGIAKVSIRTPKSENL